MARDMEKIKIACISFSIGAILSIIGCMVYGSGILSDFRGRLDTARSELERVDKKLIRSQPRIIRIEKIIYRNIERVGNIEDGLERVLDLTRDSQGILARVRKSQVHLGN